MSWLHGIIKSFWNWVENTLNNEATLICLRVSSDTHKADEIKRNNCQRLVCKTFLFNWSINNVICTAVLLNSNISWEQKRSRRFSSYFLQLFMNFPHLILLWQITFHFHYKNRTIPYDKQVCLDVYNSTHNTHTMSFRIEIFIRVKDV